MVRPEDRPRFLAADPTRLKIASWCSKEGLTRGGIAKRLERASGSLSAPTTMLRQGALISAGSAGSAGTRPGAELLELNPEWLEALEQALRLQRPAVLEPGTDLLLIPLTATLTACEVLAEGASGIGWGVELDGEQLGLLLSPSRTSDDNATIRVVAAFGQAGVNPVRIKLRAPMGADDLRQWATAVVRGEDRALQRGDHDDPE